MNVSKAFINKDWNLIKSYENDEDYQADEEVHAHFMYIFYTSEMFGINQNDNYSHYSTHFYQFHAPFRDLSTQPLFFEIPLSAILQPDISDFKHFTKPCFFCATTDLFIPFHTLITHPGNEFYDMAQTSNMYEVFNEYYSRLKRFTWYPTLPLLKTIASKEYVRIPTIREKMLPTWIYPDDIAQIQNLPNGDYHIKFGLTSSSEGVFEYAGTGQRVIDEINRISKDKHLFSDCVQIQPSTHITEFKFFVVDGYISSIICEEGEHVAAAKLFSEQDHQLDPRLVTFCKEVYGCLSQYYSDPGFLRIDIFMEGDCDYENLIMGRVPDKIYLNEVEPLGSGWKNSGFLDISNEPVTGSGSTQVLTNDSNTESGLSLDSTDDEDKTMITSTYGKWFGRKINNIYMHVADMLYDRLLDLS